MSDCSEILITAPENGAQILEVFQNRELRSEIYSVLAVQLLDWIGTCSDQKVKLPTLYDRIETQLRALESLGVTTEKYAAMLFPLVESCLSEEVLRS
ncbi:hypothetical protein CEXT_6381 [Caerostris extrusa]|uniref:Uncharacterized protein n=1 Tax=Caerostris extrusa TaxID=172846 RepID=A0AAV4U4P2_CAEEX|nr:hypothetical protein CEXT_6381 [Caerostris extrusa]